LDFPVWRLQPAVEPAEREGVMSRTTMSELRSLEGRQVSVALADGSRIDDCQLVSAGRPGVQTLWVFCNGADRFVPLGDVLEVWELQAA
jgi:hypothetical protein